MYNSQSDPSFMISNLDEILYISSHTRKWSKSACPLDILEPNSFTCGEFNIKYSWQRSRQLDHNTTHRVVFPRGPEWITRLKSHPYNHKIESHSLPSTGCHLPLQRGIPTMQVKNQSPRWNACCFVSCLSSNANDIFTEFIKRMLFNETYNQ